MNYLLARIVAVFCATALTAAAADWPQFRGPERSAISQETGLLRSWPANGPKMLWRADGLGQGYGTVAVVGDRAYVVANRGMGSEYVTALSVADGSQIWSTEMGPVGKPDQQPPYPSARSTPTVVGDVLYALSSNGDLVSIQTATGEILWRKSLLEDFAGQSGKWAYAESPLIDGEVLIVAPGGAEATMVALNRETGATIWKSAIPGGEPAGFASAIPTEAAGRKQYVQFLDKGIVGVDAKTGEFLWRYGGTASGPANIPTVVVEGDLVYTSNARRFGGALVRISNEAAGTKAEEVYFSRTAPNTLGGQVLVDGILYGTNQDGLTAARFESGELLWQSEGGPGSVQYADGHLYVHWESSEVSLVEATPEAFREKGRFTPPNPPGAANGLPKVTWTYPVAANGRLYIRDLGTLWCYDISAQ
ncbi:MAG: PQQ-like beta-propeller repeat protein [Acidobacteria bacterium]|nr:PQQ-like beta-propeller repeat protein [Acidobacteriota bacterium]